MLQIIGTLLLSLERCAFWSAVERWERADDQAWPEFIGPQYKSDAFQERCALPMERLLSWSVFEARLCSAGRLVGSDARVGSDLCDHANLGGAHPRS